MSTSASIRTFLQGKLAAMLNMPALAEEGVKFNNAVGVPWMRFKLLPAETTNSSIGAHYVLELNGLAQVDVFYPPLKGMDASEATVQAIITEFAPGAYTSGADQVIIDATWAEATREEPAWLHTPITVRWRAFRMATA